MDSSESRSAIVLELAEEFLDRYRRGQRPSLKEYADRHPELAGEIRDVFPAMAMMENIALADESLDGGATGVDGPPSASPRLERLGDFRILREVGHGGMGIVYEAEQVSLGRHVALKVLPRTMVRDARQLVRFEREARAAARLHHTNIVPVFGVGEQDGTPYYVMQFIAGLGLDTVIDELRQLRTGGAAAPGDPSGAPDREVTAAAVAHSLLTGRFEPGDDEALALAATLARTGTGPLAATDPGPSGGSGTAIGPNGFLAAPSDPAVGSSSVLLPGRGTESRSGRARPATYWQSVARVGVQVAEALDYAHKQGVVHRDVKPSNLLLDARGTVWVTDFGLAKAGDQQDLTHTGDILGTLRYMPPEAFEGKSDGRGDIYSLGLTLYEMLAFRPAYEERDRHRLIKRVTSEEPPRLKSLNPEVPRDLETIIHKAIDRDPGHRYATPGELAADLQRFLEDEPILARRTTPMERCARWCRHNRLVASLAASLIGFLVIATAVSLIGLARMRRLAVRETAARLVADQQKDAAEEARTHEAEQHRLAEASRHRAEAALKDARVQRDRAEANFARARAAVDDYLTRVSESQLLQVPGLQPLRRDLLQSALGFYQDFLKERGDDPTIRAGLAAANLRVGKILRELGQGDKAKSAFQQARDLYQAIVERAPDDREVQGGLAEALDGAGQSDEAIAIWERLVRNDPDPARYQRALADAYNSRGIQETRADRTLEWYLKSLPLREALVRRDPGDPEAQLGLSYVLNNLGVQLARQHQHREALAMYERGVEHVRLAYERSPRDIQSGRMLATGLRNVGGAHWQLGEREAVLPFYQEANDVARQLAVENPSVPYLQSGLYWQTRALGEHLRQLGREDEAARAMRQARAALERLPSRTPKDLYNLACARALCAAPPPGGDKTPDFEDDRRERLRMADLAVAALEKAIGLGFHNVELIRTDDDLKAIRDRDDFKKLVARVDLEARARKVDELARADGASPTQQLEHNREALALRERLAAADPKDRRLRGDIAASQQAIGLIQLGLNRLDEARAALERARSLREELAREAPDDARSQVDLAATAIALGKLEWKAGRLTEAARLWNEGEDRLARGNAKVPESQRDPRGLAATRRDIGDEYARRGLWAEAATLYARASEAGLLINPIEDRKTAMLALGVGDEAAYRRLCARILDRVSKSTANQSTDAADWGWVLVMAPGGISDPTRALKLLGTTAPDQNAWYNHALALALYRCGRFEEAIRRIHQWDGRRGENWSACGLDEVLSAMALHRLGREDEARRALEEAEAAQARTARTILERDGEIPWNWWDWADALALRREAEKTVRGKAGPDPPRATLAAARLHAKLGRTDLAEAGFREAIAAMPDDPDVWLARAEAFAELGHPDRSKADLAKAATLQSADPMPWIRRGRWLAGRDDRTGADAAFARAASLTPGELNRFIEAGWWVVGPYPKGLETSCPPERDPDPAYPVVASDGGTALSWRPVATGQYGQVDLRAVFDADNISAYALTYVYSPDERTATLMVSGDDQVRVWLNGRPVHKTTRAIAGLWGLDRVPVTLRAGRNTLLVKVNQATGPHSLILRIADNPIDRGIRFAELGLWREAADQFDRALRGSPAEDRLLTYRYAALLQASGQADRCRRMVEELFERYRSAPDSSFAAVYEVAVACDFALDARVDFGRLAGLAEQCADYVKRRDGTASHYCWAALTNLRAGKFERALEVAQEWRGAYGWKAPLLALIHHGLGRSDEARRMLADADRGWEEIMRSASASASGEPQSAVYGAGWLEFILIPMLRREAKAKIEGADPGEDPRFRAYQDRVRDRLKHLDKATADYDLELMFDPGQARLWLARGRRLGELGRWKEAEADLNKAVELGKNDPGISAERGRILAGLDDRDHEAVAVAWATALSPADPMPWIRHGRWLAGRGDRNGADAAFARAASLTPDELNRFIEAGWWVVGPYPKGLETSCPPEHDPDPARPVAASDGSAALSWRPVEPNPQGLVNLGAVFNANDISAYALTYVYSPDERTATLLVGGDDLVRVWLNGRLVHELTQRKTWLWQIDPAPVTLRAGTNTLLVKVNQWTEAHCLILRLADHPIDRGERLARLGLWREAADQYDRALRGRLPEDLWAMHWPEHAALLWASGHADRCRRLGKAVLDRLGPTSASWIAGNVARTCDFSPGGRIDFARLAGLHGRYAEEKRRADGLTWDFLPAALTHLRAGQSERALDLIHEFHEKQSGLKPPLLALADHGLGRENEARQALADADKGWEETMQWLSAAGERQAPLAGWWLDFVVQDMLHREAKAKIEGADPGEDPRFRAYQDRVRDRLKHLDKATADYDLELMFDPGQARLWLARGRRLGELGRWKEAEADLDRAVGLGKDDPRNWAERGRIRAGSDRPDRAADDFVQALDLAATAGGPILDGIASDVASWDAVYDRVAAGRPDDRRIREWRIRQLARRGWWDRAALVAGEFSRTKDDERITFSDHKNYDRLVRTCLLMMAGDRDGYRRLCREALDRGRLSDDAAALMLADRPGILAPDALDDFDLPIQMAERALKGPLPDQVFWPGCTLYVLGAAHYRAGHYDQAVRCCRRSLEEYPRWMGKVLNWPVLALAYHRLGNAEEARKALSEAWKQAGRTRRGRFDSDLLLESDYASMVNWLELMVWLREAEAVILDDPTFPADPFAPGS